MGREWSKINEMEKYLVRFLCSFFRVFGGYLEKIEINNDKIIGIISYEDESANSHLYGNFLIAILYLILSFFWIISQIIN